MTVTGRSVAVTLGMLSLLAGCQILSGLSGLHDTGGTGGATSSTSGSTTSASTTSATSSTSTGMPLPCQPDCPVNSCNPMTGTCKPYELFTVGATPARLASNGMYLYTVEGSFIHVYTVSDGTPVNTQPAGVVIDMIATDDFVFYLTASTIFAMAADGSAAGMQVYGFADGTVSALRTDGNFVYWDEGNAFNRHLPVTTVWNSATPLPLAAQPPVLFDVDTADIYWWRATGNGDSIQASPTATPSASAIYSASVPAITSFSADPEPNSGYVYWITTSVTSELQRASKAGGTKPDEQPFQTLNGAVGRVLAGVRQVIWSDAVGGSCTSGMVVNRSYNNGIKDVVEALTDSSHLLGDCPVFAQDASAFYYNDGPHIMRVLKVP